MGRVRIDNFSKALRRDAAIDPQRLFGMHTLENYDIGEGTGHLRKRRGSTMWRWDYQQNETRNIEQVYEWLSPEGGGATLLVIDGRLYILDINLDTEEVMINGDTSHRMDNPPYQFEEVGNRLFFVDDNNLYWADIGSFGDNTTYPLTIDKPDVSNLEFAATFRVGDLRGNDKLVLTTTRFYAQPFELEYDQFVNNVTLMMQFSGDDLKGFVRVQITGGSTTTPDLGDDKITSEWVYVRNLAERSAGAVVLDIDTLFDIDSDGNNTASANDLKVINQFTFKDGVTLESGERYYLIIETDSEYRDSYTEDERLVSVVQTSSLPN